jgi:hypothetical protein
MQCPCDAGTCYESGSKSLQISFDAGLFAVLLPHAGCLGFEGASISPIAGRDVNVDEIGGGAKDGGGANTGGDDMAGADGVNGGREML